MRRTLTLGLASVALVGLGLGTTALASAATPVAKPAVPAGPSLGSEYPRGTSAAYAAPRLTTRPLVEPMTVAPDTIQAGGRVTVSGQHCAADQPVFFSLGSDRRFDLGHLTADRDGAFHGTVRIPAAAKAGPA